MELLEKIFNAGVVGAGGAGFPTHIKLNCSVEYLIINAAECEPLLFTDKYIINNFSKEVVKASWEIGKIVKAEKIYIAVKKVYEKEVECLEKAIKNTGLDVKLFLLDNYYPAGDEQMIVKDVTGRTVKAGNIPLSVGCVVSNVATVLNVFEAQDGKPVTYKFVTVTGDVATPKVLKVPLGITFNECIEASGGSTVSNYQVISGGPMMGKVHDSKNINSLVVTKTTSGIIVLGDENNFIARLKNTSLKQTLNRAKSACIQCQFCTDLCPRKLSGHNINPHKVMRQMASNPEYTNSEILKEALICCECGVCETFACPMGLSPRQVNIHVKTMLAGEKFQDDAQYKTETFREYRKVPPAKIMARMGLSKYYSNKVKEFQEISTKTVKIPLKQHIGAPSEPVVKVGDYVTAGQIIAKGNFDKVSANIHSSISGEVVNINDKIEIKGVE